MKVKVYMLGTAQPIVFEKAINCYSKGGMYCILTEDDDKRKVHKYPLINIFKTEEDY